MLSRHPMEPQTHHDRTLADLVSERNNLANQVSEDQLLSLKSEEGHVFDHEPGYSDYHFDHHRQHEYDRHAEYYDKAQYSMYLEQQNQHEFVP